MRRRVSLGFEEKKGRKVEEGTRDSSRVSQDLRKCLVITCSGWRVLRIDPHKVNEQPRSPSSHLKTTTKTDIHELHG